MCDYPLVDEEGAERIAKEEAYEVKVEVWNEIDRLDAENEVLTNLIKRTRDQLAKRIRKEREDA